MMMEGDKLVSESKAIAVVNITSTGLKPDHWDFTLDRKPVTSPVTISTGTVVTCLKGTLPESLTVEQGLTPGKYFLFFERRNGELVVLYSLQVLDGGRVEWYGKEWRSDFHNPKRARTDDGRSFSPLATVCDEIREEVKAEKLNGKK